jgi:hypothetical protein
MLLEKVNEMKFEREELLSLIKELKEEITLFRQAQPNEFPMRPAQPKAQEKAQLNKNKQIKPATDDGWTKVTHRKVSNGEGKGPKTYASIVKKSLPS